jgi:hypothetical protein
MSINCARCRFECANDDAFCRKCGAPLAQEANFTELAAESAPLQAEVTTVEVITPAGPVVRPGSSPRDRALALTKKVGAKVSEALKSEQGKKLAQGATALAVAVGVELVAQAANKLAKPATGRDNRKLDRAPTSLPDAMLKAMEDHLASSNAPIVEDYYYRERIYIRRIIRRRQG